MNKQIGSCLSPRDNLLKVFRHEQPGWIPVHLGHIAPTDLLDRSDMDPELDAALGTIQWGDSSARILDEYLCLDALDACNPPIRLERRGVSEKHTACDNGRTSTTTYTTSHGELREVQRRAQDDIPSYCTEHLVKSNDDLPALTDLFENATPVVDPAAVDRFRERKVRLGDRGLIFCALQGTPVGMMVRMYSGPETMAYLWADRDDRLRRLFKAMTECHVRQAQLLAELGFDLIYNMDDTSTTCISPAMFEEFCMDYTDRMADAVHARGVFYVHHSCGHIRRLLDLYRQTKMDAVDALNLAPPRGMGDIPALAEAFERLGPNIAILTGLGVRREQLDDECASDIRRVFRDAAPGRNIVFSAKGATITRMKFLAAECRSHQHMYAPVRKGEAYCI